MRDFAIATATVFALLFVGCAGEASRQTSNTFYYNENDEPKSLDPVRINNRSSWWVGELIYVGLVGLDKDLKPIPKLARTWDIDSAGTTLTFHLRNDVRFADDASFGDGKGRVVTAHDVKYSFERVCNPASGTTGFWLFRGKVEGADEYFASREDSNAANDVAGVSGFTAVDDTTFRISLTAPFPPFFAALSSPFGYVVPKEAIEKYGKDYFRTPVGAGPFRLVSWKMDEGMVLVKNANYFETDESGARLPYLDSVSVSFLQEPGAVVTSFTEGKLDLLSSVDPSFADRILADGGKTLTEEFGEYTLFTSPVLSTEYYGFMLDPKTEAGKTSPMATNRHLRVAFNYAVDRERITRFVLKGQALPAVNGPIPPGTPGFSGVKGYTFDQEMALRHLDSAGFPNGKGLPPITLQLGTDPRTSSVAEAVQEDLKKVGVPVEIKQVDFGTHLDMVRSGKVAFWRTSWIGDYPDAENFMALFYSPYTAPSGPNTTHFNNATVDSLYRAALAPGLSIENRAAIYGRAERIVLDEAPWIFLYYNAIHQLTQPWISGFAIDPLQRLSLTRVRKTSTDNQQPA